MRNDVMKTIYFMVLISLLISGCSPDITRSLIHYSDDSWDEYYGYFITHDDGKVELVNHGKELQFRNNELFAEMIFKHGKMLYHCLYYENGNKRFEYFYDKKPLKGIFYNKKGDKILETFFIDGNGFDFDFNDQGELENVYSVTEGKREKKLLSIYK